MISSLMNQIIYLGEELEPIRILLADDYPYARASTRSVLEREDSFKVVAEAGDGEEAVNMTLRFKPDVAIVDIAMPVLDGIEATKRIKQLHPATAVVLLTILDDEEFVNSALEVGATGYLLKGIRGHELIQAVREACSEDPNSPITVLWSILDRFGN